MIKHSMIYSISNFATKASGLVLLPIYTKYFTVEEFGRLALLLATTLITSQVLILGQSQSIVRFTTLAEYIEKKKQVFFTIGVTLLLLLIGFIILGEFSLFILPNDFNSEIPYTYYLHICLYLIVFMVINNFILNKLRADERSVLYTSLSLIKLAVTIILTLYFIIVINLNIESVLIAQLFGEIISLLFAIPTVYKSIELNYNKSILKKSLGFGLPLIFSVFALNLLNVGDRYIIKYLAGEFSVGLFELASKISGIHYMFLVVPFSLSFLPKAYKLFKSDGDIDYYKNLMTYFCFVLLWGGLILAFLAKPVIELFVLDESFYPSSRIVPILILGNIFMGLTQISSLGMYLEGKSVKIAIISLFSAIVLLGLDFISIPNWGYQGAAYSKLLTFICLFLISLFYSNKVVKIPFEYKRITLLFITAFICYYLGNLFSDGSLFIVFSFILFLLYPIILWMLNFFKPNEKQTVVNILRNFFKLN
ncbi:MAG: oligosaccharide flippase family protein [Ignavibacteriae bacterium]|nr:oligosaccharide flippase family protein [Ignavibacteriota bacterium]